jgi:hypothetical protein
MLPEVRWCADCRKAAALPDRQRCEACLAKRRAARRRELARRREERRCLVCGLALSDAGRRFCASCAERRRQQRRRRRQDLKNDARCPECGAPVAQPGRWCHDCVQRNSGIQHRSRERRKADGLCISCGKAAPQPGRVRCAACLQRKAEYQRLAKQRRAEAERAEAERAEARLQRSLQYAALAVRRAKQARRKAALLVGEAARRERQARLEIERLQAALASRDVVIRRLSAELSRRAASAPPQGDPAADEEPLPLSGQRLLVVGDTPRAEAYCQVLRELGAEDVEFVEGMDLTPGMYQRLSGLMRCKDLTVLVTAHIHHTVMGMARRLRARMILVPVAGVASFRRAVLEGVGRIGVVAAN